MFSFLRNNSPTAIEERTRRAELRISGISDSDLKDAWRTTGVALTVAARAESQVKARDIESKAVERIQKAKKKLATLTREPVQEEEED